MEYRSIMARCPLRVSTCLDITPNRLISPSVGRHADNTAPIHLRRKRLIGPDGAPEATSRASTAPSDAREEPNLPSVSPCGHLPSDVLVPVSPPRQRPRVMTGHRTTPLVGNQKKRVPTEFADDCSGVRPPRSLRRNTQTCRAMECICGHARRET